MRPHPCQNGRVPQKRKAEGDQPRRKRVVDRVAARLESRFLDAAEVATSTTSADENMADAVVEALIGHHDQDEPARGKRAKTAKSNAAARRSRS